jgi:hypothetical protein
MLGGTGGDEIEYTNSLHRRRGLRREPGRSHDIVQGSSSGQASRPQARPSDDNFEVRFTSLARIDDARRPDRQCAQRATIMMPPVDFKGIKAVALRSARSAMGAPATGGQKTDRIRPTQGCYVMSNGLTTIASQLGKLLPRLGSNHDAARSWRRRPLTNLRYRLGEG